MSKINKNQVKMTTKTLTYCALLTAMSVVLARFLGFHIGESTRISLEAVPVILAGLLFGPVAGGLVGFVADFVGCMFSPYGFNVMFILPPILYGVCSGLLRNVVVEKFTYVRLLLTQMPAFVFGAMLWQSLVLTYVYAGDGAFWQNYLVRLGARGFQYAVTLVVDTLVIYLLFKSRLFHRLGVWPPAKKGQE